MKFKQSTHKSYEISQIRGVIVAKASFPKELKCREINAINKNWLDDFRRATNFVDSYYTTIENFFKFCEFQNKPFNTFTTKPDIEKYVEIMMENGYTTDTMNSLNWALSSFKNFLIRNNPTIFPENFLADLYILRFDDDNPSDAFALSLGQINHIRDYNLHDIRDEYIFEIYFQLGIMKKEITICNPSNNTNELSCFKLGDKKIRYNAKIAELLAKLPQNMDLKLTPELANFYLSHKIS